MDHEAVLDLPIYRLRQIVDQIRDRLAQEFKAQARITEWSTRTLAAFIAGTTGKEGAALQKEAAKIRLPLPGEDDTEADAAATSLEEYDWIEHGSATALSRNQSGSAERLMSGFGGG